MKTIEAVVEFAAIGVQEPGKAGWDEPPPLNLSTWIWLNSNCSQRVYEAELLGMGQN